MSAQPQNTAPDLVEIEIDGKPLQAPKGSMIIQAADAAGIRCRDSAITGSSRWLPIAASAWSKWR